MPGERVLFLSGGLSVVSISEKLGPGDAEYAVF